MLAIYIMVFVCSSFLVNAEVFTMTPTHLHLRGQCDEDTCNTWTVKLKATDGQEQITQLKEAMFRVMDKFELASSETGNKHITLKGGRNLQGYTDILAEAVHDLGDHHYYDGADGAKIEKIHHHDNSYDDELHNLHNHGHSEDYHHYTGAPIEKIENHHDPVYEEGLHMDKLHQTGDHHHNTNTPIEIIGNHHDDSYDDELHMGNLHHGDHHHINHHKIGIIYLHR